MNRELARDISRIAAAECVPWLDKVLNAGFSANCYRDILIKLRDKLHATCLRYEQCTFAEEHEEFYLPVFDALSYLNDALQDRPVNRAGVERCRETLHGLIAEAVTA